MNELVEWVTKMNEFNDFDMWIHVADSEKNVSSIVHDFFIKYIAFWKKDTYRKRMKTFDVG